MTTPNAPTAPQFNPNAPHQQRPHLRPVRGFAAQSQDGQMALGLTDARQVSDKVVFTLPAAQMILPLMDGQKTVDEIVAAVGRGLTRELLESLIAQLDDAGLLMGPTFDAILAKMRKDFDSSSTLPPASTAAFADLLLQSAAEADPTFADKPEAERNALAAARMKELFDQWIAAALKDAPNPSADTLPKVIVTPHLDYPRGWLNYASAWGRLRVTDRPDRVIVLGTNHFGEATGVCACDKGYESPLGICNVDTEALELLKRNLGGADAEKLLKNRYDHEREHSIELQIPWIQHVFGDASGQFPKVLAVLIHDPTIAQGASYDGNGLGLPEFMAAMEKTLASLPGKTLIVCSADLSHAGPSFGDQVPLAGEEPASVEARNKVFQHDQEMVGMLLANKPDDMVAAMSWQQNPTRWCSIGNLFAGMKLGKVQKVELFNFAAAMDEQGLAMVSSVSLGMW